MRYFVGYDPARKDIFEYCTKTVDVPYEKIGASVLNSWYRKRKPTDSTEFSVCRFLVPLLSNYQGWSLYFDDDFYWRVSPRELEQYQDPKCAVMVVKHDYVPKNLIKYENLNQLKYERKNWSSLMLFNNSHPDCQKLTDDRVQQGVALDLHQFKWTDNVGSLPREYNFLVGEYKFDETAKALHYTNGLCLE